MRFSGPEGPKSLGIETVYQDLALVNTFDTVQNLYLGREMTRLGGLALDHGGMIRDAKRHLADLSIRLPSLREKVRYLSGGQRQAVAISRATGWGAKLIIMDEPTAALGVKEVAPGIAARAKPSRRRRFSDPNQPQCRTRLRSQ